MHNRISLVKLVTRILYASGFVFLIVGLLLSALSTSALAAGAPLPNLAQAPTQITPPNCNCTTVTPKPTGPTPTKTGISKTPAPTHPPVLINLSSICGYTFDNFELWRVSNRSTVAVDYVWRVVGTNETGSGTVAANSAQYFTTSAGLKTVRLYVNDQVVDTESCLAPCKKELELSYTCTEDGLTWHATNANDFGVSYTVLVDGQPAGSGTISANSTVNVAKSTSGAHSVELTWTDTRPGTHSVTLSSPPNSCVVVETETPTPTEATLTPTPTSTVTETVEIPSFTPTPTSTVTETVEIPSFTPTQTSTVTQTVVIPSVTHTPTRTLTSEPGVTPSFTSTPTQTLTRQPSATPTVTPTTTRTAPASSGSTISPTPTATNIVTLPPPAGTVTSTPVLIPVTGVDLTRPIGANSLSIFGSLVTNIGLFCLGLALALTGIGSQFKN